jgi:tetratricopeptide (TPR) repeat protein
LELYERALSTFVDRDGDNGLPPAVVHNRARALEAIGRFTEARSAYELANSLAAGVKIPDTQGASLMGLASVAEQLGDRSAAEEYVKAADALLDSQGGKTISMRLAVLHGRLAMLDGNLDEARRRYNSVLDRHGKNAPAIGAALGRAEVELLTGDAAAAVVDARSALGVAKSLQGTMQYSNYTGLSWLMLGRALQAQGDRAQAHEAFLAAVNNLSNTVDEDHPDLVQARKLLTSSG